MLWTILVILLALWLVGLLLLDVAGGFIQLLLVIALVMFIINLMRGRNTV